jgi:dihydrofolate synthase/folylpolyglutamate synthase
MSYNETINYLYNLQKHGIKFGLDNINRLITAFDNPHKSFLTVHVGGTNGKGSTSAIIASILQTAGLKVGLYTSPHIVSFTERISINGKEITEDEIIKLAGEVKDIVAQLEDFSPTFFEVVTVMALLHFKRENVDIAVVEVGMGGRLDATNIITPEVSVITSISYDHSEFLGNTLKEIAHEKAGIIKRGIPVVTSYQEPEVMQVIREKAIEKGTELYTYGKDFLSILKTEDISGISFDYHSYSIPRIIHLESQNTLNKIQENSEESHDSLFTLNDLFLPLTGKHQVQNVSVAIKAAMIVLNNNISKMGNGGTGKRRNKKAAISRIPPFTDFIYQKKNIVSIIRTGLAKTRWPGRLEVVKEDPLILIDGAHNPAASEALSRTLKKIFMEKYRRIIIVLGIMGDKDVSGIMEPLLPLASEIILTYPEYSRAASPEKLADCARSLGYSDMLIAPSVKDAIKMAKDLTLDDPRSSLIVITGSFYTIGEAKEAIGTKGVLARLRE